MEETESIIELLARMKAAVEQFERTRAPQLLDDIDRDFQQFARLVTLYLVSERDTYYGYFFMAMTFRSNFECRTIAGIRLDAYPPVFETNPLILLKYSLREILYIFCHEVDHVVFNHPAEMVKSNPEKDPQLFELFNYAADAAVNDQLNREARRKGKFLKAPRGLVTSGTLARKFNLSGLSQGESYLYYFNLIKEKAKSQDQDQSPAENGIAPIPQSNNQQKRQGKGKDENKNESQGESEAGNSEGNRNENAEANDSNQGESNGSAPAEGSRADASSPSEARAQAAVTAAEAAGNLEDHTWLQGDDDNSTDIGEALAEAAKELVNEAVDIMGSESRGMMPARFTSQVERLNQPAKLNWQAILKKYVGAVTAGKTKTRTRLNRRQPKRFDLSGTKESKTLKICVAIDTSGSMSDDYIAQIFREIFAIISRKRFELTVIEFDMEIQSVYRVKTPDDLPNHVLGRGGTYFTPLIEYINERRYFRDALLIIFTDGYAEGSIPKPLTYRNLWVILGNVEALSVEKPYGAVMPLDD